MKTYLAKILLALPPWAAVAFALFFGWVNSLPVVVTVLFYCMALDIFIGMLHAGRDGKLSSATAYSGASKKGGILIIVALAFLCAKHLSPFGVEFPAGEVVAAFYVVEESVSILEHAKVMGLEIPEFLSRAIAKLRAPQVPPVA